MLGAKSTAPMNYERRGQSGQALSSTVADTGRWTTRIRGSTVVSRGFFDSLFGGNSESTDASDVDVEYVEDPPVDLASLAEGTFLRGRTLARCYLASRDGWSALDFHRRCDFKGPTIIVARVQNSRLLIGGFMPIEFKSSDDYTELRNDFLFASRDGSSISIVRKKQGAPGPVYDYARGGPQWGSDGLVIGVPTGTVGGMFAGPSSESTGVGSLRTVSSRLGLDYDMLDGTDSLLGKGVKDAKLQEVEVYYSPEIANR
eukprot:gnl/TRDRNA2_/TRDRNA2_89914_c0_seq1.p1 gnl/TRDRNA2_/TRDRNA2_89914_c0~~gnl/TRDRNA2_/TRDRNA2_89914_c0_seq1.p1  ORF type:complete len:258 (+),score=33.60 gnl/TRDRNA2_/TRDRNA2_89914_c0_seq1:80-853(+)